jgi:hypothetical protein
MANPAAISGWAVATSSLGYSSLGSKPPCSRQNCCRSKGLGAAKGRTAPIRRGWIGDLEAALVSQPAGGGHG